MFRILRTKKPEELLCNHLFVVDFAKLLFPIRCMQGNDLADVKSEKASYSILCLGCTYRGVEQIKYSRLNIILELKIYCKMFTSYDMFMNFMRHR